MSLIEQRKRNRVEKKEVQGRLKKAKLIVKVEKSSVNIKTEGEGRRWESIRDREERNGAQEQRCNEIGNE